MGKIKYTLHSLSPIDLPAPSDNFIFDYNKSAANMQNLTTTLKALNSKIEKFRDDYDNYAKDNKNTIIDEEVSRALTIFYGTPNPVYHMRSIGTDESIVGQFNTTYDAIIEQITRLAENEKTTNEANENARQELLKKLSEI